MKLKQQFKEAVAAAFSGIWISSNEHEDAIGTLGEACKEQGWTILTWDPERGLRKPGQKETASEEEPNPLTALAELRNVDTANTRGVLVCRNFLPFIFAPDGRIMAPTLLQSLQRTIEEGSAEGHHVVILAHEMTKIPIELEKLVYVLEHDLPDNEERYQLLGQVVKDPPKIDSPEAKRILDASAGLTRMESLGAFSKSMTKHKKLVPETVFEIKAKALAKGGALEVLTGQQLAESGEPTGFTSLGGMNAAKEFLLQMFNSPRRSKKVRPQGITLVGPSGTGKSALGKALGQEIGRAAVRLDVGALMGSLVGETEAQTRAILKRIDASQPLVLIVDEVEKALAGSSGGEHDSGVGARMLGALLTWLNDHTSDIFPVFTANDISRLPPELFRAERIDGIFMIDIPIREEKDVVWNIYEKYYELEPALRVARPNDDNWTGAEIKSCCRQSALRNLTLEEAAVQVVPIYNTAREKIQGLRTWADKRCLSASYRGLYDKNGPGKVMQPSEIAARPRRKISTGT